MRAYINLSLTIILTITLISSQILVSVKTFQDEVKFTHPPTPSFKLTNPKINEVTYMIVLDNQNETSVDVRLDVALPKMWPPDTIIQIKDVKSTLGEIEKYVNRENEYLDLTATVKPKEYLQINVTFYALKYRVDFYTEKSVQNFSYKDNLTIFTQPEKYIESNDALIVRKAEAIAGEEKDPIRIAERLYNFVISYLTYEKQPEIHGASWALLNGRGDCTEYGTLFVALLRALGIPSRIVIGHVSKERSRGGIANATEFWINSPHLWAEFYVEGFGWIPVDPTFGVDDPQEHFGVSGTDYLPIMKGPDMETPYRALFTFKPTSIKCSAYLIVKPLKDLSPLNQTLIDFYVANDLTNKVRLIAYSAHKYGFDIGEAHESIRQTYHLLQKTTEEMAKDLSVVDEYIRKTRQNALKTLKLILDIVIKEAEKTVSSSWRTWKLLGALSGEIYLARARTCELKGDFLGAILNAHYAVSAVEKAPNIFLFLCSVSLSFFTIWVIAKRRGG